MQVTAAATITTPEAAHSATAVSTALAPAAAVVKAVSGASATGAVGGGGGDGDMYGSRDRHGRKYVTDTEARLAVSTIEMSRHDIAGGLRCPVSEGVKQTNSRSRP